MPFGTPDFKSDAFDHSATSPGIDMYDFEAVTAKLHYSAHSHLIVKITNIIIERLGQDWWAAQVMLARHRRLLACLAA